MELTPAMEVRMKRAIDLALDAMFIWAGDKSKRGSYLLHPYYVKDMRGVRDMLMKSVKEVLKD